MFMNAMPWLQASVHIGLIVKARNKLFTYLVFVQLTILIFLLSLLLEGDDDEAHKYIHHEESNEDEVGDKED